MVTLNDVIRTATELATGENTASVKFALWVSALSTQQSLSANCRLAELLRPYIDTPLPTNENGELWVYLSQAKGVLYRSHIRALYHIEGLERAGELNGLENIGDNYTSQLAWRERVYHLVHGYGMAYKTVSFAALIIDPLHCELVPVDRHVNARLGFNKNISCKSLKQYLEREQLVMSERNDAGFNDIPLGLWHWFKWEQYRQTVGASKSHSCESHNGLNCRVR